MKTMKSIRVAAFVAASLPTLVMAAAQTRDAAQPVPVGSASLSGVVTSTDDPQAPIRQAVVTLSGPALGGDRSVMTDDAGRFTFERLPAGAFTVTASKASFLAASFGAKRPAHPGTPVAVAAGQRVTGLSLRLAKGGVIAGVVRAADGVPLPDMQVMAMRVGDPPRRVGLPGLGAMDGTVTDDRGAYRLFGLAPGSYVVVGLMSGVQQAEMHRRTTAEIDAAFREAQQKGTAPPTPPTPPPIFAAAPVYYPGTVVAANAVRVDVTVGSTHEDVSFAVEPVPSAAIDGIVQRPPGKTGPVTLMISGAGSPMPLSISMAPRLLMAPGPDGHFRFVNLAPGHYSIAAIMTDSSPSPAGPPAGDGGAGGGGGRGAVPSPMANSPPTWWASADVDVNGEDISGVALAMQPGMSVSGRVVFDATTATPPKDLAAMRVTLAPLVPLGSAMMNGTSYGVMQRGAFGSVRDDGTFDIADLAPGPYRLSVTMPGANGLADFWARSAVSDGLDLLDTLVTVAPGQDVDRVVVTLTDRHTEIAGGLQTPSGRPATEYFVVALPTDHALWLANARRVRSTRPATDGHFAFADLPPGSYVLAAVDDLEPSDLSDPKILETIAGAGVQLTLGEGEKKRQDLRLAGGDQNAATAVQHWRPSRPIGSGERRVGSFGCAPYFL
jgi:hypothetical protein